LGRAARRARGGYSQRHHLNEVTPAAPGLPATGALEPTVALGLPVPERLERVEAGVAQQHVGVLAAVSDRQVLDGSVALVEVGAALEAVIERLDERMEGVGVDGGYVSTTGVRRYRYP